MASVLVIGYDPQGIPGIDVRALRAALEEDLARFAEHGIDAMMTTVVLDGTAEPTFFEQIINLIGRHAPGAAIAFNTGVGDSLETARRRL
ncbi:hypothetical protein [Streptomyces erythrochromogenes]|uniref:hypothetical protein n=1 Tax=Streptomyces erythrochromogenes TaxID=285574 RepID=UPI00380694A9